MRLESLSPQMRDSLFQRRLIDIGEHQMRSAPCELSCGGQTDTVRATSDDDAFVFESAHGATVTDETARLKPTPASW